MDDDDADDDDDGDGDGGDDDDDYDDDDDDASLLSREVGHEEFETDDLVNVQKKLSGFPCPMQHMLAPRHLGLRGPCT
eukprot:6786714-Karenia_brevis.AAC.1